MAAAQSQLYSPSRINSGPFPFKNDEPFGSKEVSGDRGKSDHHSLRGWDSRRRDMLTSIPCLQNTDGTESICNDVSTFRLATMVKSLMNVPWNVIHEGYDLFPTRRHGQEEISGLRG
jgi:hypothetical protein